MNKLYIAILRKTLVKYELSVITNSSEEEISDNLTDVANACKDVTNMIDRMMSKKR